MAKLTFPAAAKPYRGFIEQLRGWATTTASFIERNPGSKGAIADQLRPLANASGAALVETATVLASVGSGSGTTATITVSAAGVITAVVLS